MTFVLTATLLSQAASATFIENTAFQVPAKDGWWGGNTEAAHNGPVFADNKVFIAYMTNGTAYGSSHDIVALMYDYATGSWSRSLVDTVTNTGNDGHNAPSIYVNPKTGNVEVYYGGIACSYAEYGMGGGPGKGPGYKVSSAPYSISSWGPRQFATLQGNNYIGGFTPDGTLHLFGNLNYARRSPSGVWSGPHVLIKNSAGNAFGTPGGIQDARIIGSTIHYTWSPYNSSGSGRRLYYIKSTDGGNTWTNINGTASFPLAAGLNQSGSILDPSWSATIAYPFYPAAYMVHGNNESGSPSIAVFPNGRTAIVDTPNFQLWQWDGSGWKNSTVDTVENAWPIDLSMRILSNGTIVIHALALANYSTWHLLEYASSDNGTTWRKTDVQTKGAENTNKCLETCVAAPAGQRERILLQWSQTYGDGGAIPSVWHTEVAFLDRAIGPTSGASNSPPSVSLTGPNPGSVFTAPANITLSASASDSDGSIRKVDFYQGGMLIGTDTASPYGLSWTAVGVGVYHLSAKATDNSGSITTSAVITVSVSGEVTQPPQPIGGQSLFTTQTPVLLHNTDGVNYELGMRFTSTAAGKITAVRFWKDSSETGTHTGRIWSASGSLLASVAFTGETASGWQRQMLSAPLAISANTEYTVSVNTGNTYYVDTVSGLSSAISTGNLSSIVGTNGRFGPQGQFPTQSWQDSNYFRDVEFVAAPATPSVLGTGLTGTYFDNADFTGASFTRTDATVNFDWGMGAPTSTMGVDYFSVRWTGQVQAQYSQAYTFHVTADDGVRLWVNGTLLIDRWLVQAPTEYSANINLTAGAKYDIKLEYYENFGGTAAQLRWSSASTSKQIIPTSQLYPAVTGGGASGTGLSGQYFDNSDFTGATFTRTDATVNFTWGMGAPTNAMGVDYFSVRWTGQVQAQHSQTYTFHVTGDDGVRLWVNGQLLIDKWLVQSPTEYSASINLTAGTKYDIKLEYYENFGGAVAHLRWSSASTPKAIIPASQLFPAVALPTGTG